MGSVLRRGLRPTPATWGSLSISFCVCTIGIKVGLLHETVRTISICEVNYLVLCLPCPTCFIHSSSSYKCWHTFWDLWEHRARRLSLCQVAEMGEHGGWLPRAWVLKESRTFSSNRGHSLPWDRGSVVCAGR